MNYVYHDAATPDEADAIAAESLTETELDGNELATRALSSLLQLTGEQRYAIMGEFCHSCGVHIEHYCVCRNDE